MNVIKNSRLGVLLASALALTACSRAQARVVPELPALDVPAPPPRIVELIEPEPPPPEPEPPAPPAPLPARPPRVPAQQRAEPAKPEPAKVDVAPPAETPRPAEGAKAGTLQTAPAGREAQLEKAIVDMLGRASASLNRIDYGALNADARSQYDQAKGFINSAQAALRERNLVYAENLADKANTLANQLSSR